VIFIADNSNKLKRIDFLCRFLCIKVYCAWFCRAESAGRSGSSRSHVPLLLAWQFAMAGTQSRYVERTLSEDWWHQTGDTHRSSVQRSGGSVFVYMPVRRRRRVLGLFVCLSVRLSLTKLRVATCLENLEISGNLTAVMAMSGILLKIREMSGKNLVREKLPTTIYCKLHISVRTGI